MGPLELSVLEACGEAARRRQEMLPLLAERLGVLPSRVFYDWAIFGRPEQDVRVGPWEARFHGLECDLVHRDDGRLLRYDFGPGGSADAMIDFGVLQFIMTSRPPWREFPDLRRHFARAGPPYDYLSGDVLRFADVWERLEEAGMLAASDPELIDLERRHTSVEGGRTYIRLPEGLPHEVYVDCMVAGRQVLTPRALLLLQGRPGPA